MSQAAVLKKKAMSELKTKFDELEKRIQKLIHLHKQAKSENQKADSAKQKTWVGVGRGEQRFSRLEEGLSNLKEIRTELQE